MDKKSKKGEVTLGVIIIMIMGIFAALAMLPAIFDSQADMTTTRTVGNVTYTMAANGAFIDLAGQEYIGSVIVTNASSGTVIDANYTIGEGISASTGKKTVILTTTGTDFDNDALSALSVNISYEYGADGYNQDGGSRSIAGLIGLFSALAIVAFVVGAGIKEWLDSR